MPVYLVVTGIIVVSLLVAWIVTAIGAGEVIGGAIMIIGALIATGFIMEETGNTGGGFFAGIGYLLATILGGIPFLYGLALFAIGRSRRLHNNNTERIVGTIVMACAALLIAWRCLPWSPAEHGTVMAAVMGIPMFLYGGLLFYNGKARGYGKKRKAQEPDMRRDDTPGRNHK